MDMNNVMLCYVIAIAFLGTLSMNEFANTAIPTYF